MIPDSIDRDWLIERLKMALEEDIGTGDVTTDTLVDGSKLGDGIFLAREAGVLSAAFIVDAVFRLIDDSVKIVWGLNDGEEFIAGTSLGRITGRYRSLLIGERLALNLLQRFCGVATYTQKMVTAMSHGGAVLLDTRKTTPLWRDIEKYSVRMGGAQNHRMGLYDMVLVKDNHIEAAGGIEKALTHLFDVGVSVPVEVEVKDLDELAIAFRFPVDRILLDNFDPDMVKRAVEMRRTAGAVVAFELSGGINLDNVGNYADMGVEYISSGALTHSAVAVDIALELELNE